MLTKKQVFLDKLETESGVAETPDPAQDGVLCLSGTDLTPESEAVDNNRLSTSLSAEASVVTRTSTTLKRSVELRGNGISGAVVNPPDYDPLLQACALVRSDATFVSVENVTGTFQRGEEITGGTSAATGVFIALVRSGLLLDEVSGTFESGEALTGGTSAATADAAADSVTCPQYLPTSDPTKMKSVTTVYYRDGDKHTVVGSRATLSMTLPAGQPGTMEISQSGKFTVPVHEDNPVPVLNTMLPPIVESAEMAVDGTAPVGVAELSMDLANTLTRDADINEEEGIRGFRITGRAPTGAFDPEAEKLADGANPFADWKAGKLAPLHVVAGKEAGNRVFIEAPAIQYSSIGYGDREGTMTRALSFGLKKLTDAGDDELRMIWF